MRLLSIFVLCLLASPACAQTGGVFGNWSNPKGSVIQIYRCGAEACARVVAVSPSAPTHQDIENPKPALRSRPLCGLQIGWGFHLNGVDRAEGGWLYDPESGKTYRGSIVREGKKLDLRGYVGLSIFGRTEVWTAAPEKIPPCHS